MSFKPEIKLLKGFGNIAFGETIDAVEKILGKPEEIQVIEDDVLNNHTNVLHYWNKGFSLFFDKQRHNTLCSVEIDCRDTVLFGKLIFKLSITELVSLMKEQGFSLSETETHSWGEKRVSFDDAGLDCYFENNKLTTINFGIIDDDEHYFFNPN
ncbi:MAG: hypothetical protein JSU07_10200 [Bacteroidetes bacterium]|nr:hypothetical protein [Bacteroidota bacterium]